MREKEDNTERPGLVQCKVITVTLMAMLVLISIIILMRIHFDLICFLSRICFHLNVLYNFGTIMLLFFV